MLGDVDQIVGAVTGTDWPMSPVAGLPGGAAVPPAVEPPTEPPTGPPTVLPSTDTGPTSGSVPGSRRVLDDIAPVRTVPISPRR